MVHQAALLAVIGPTVRSDDAPGLIRGVAAPPSVLKSCGMTPVLVMCSTTFAPFGTVMVAGLMYMSPSSISKETLAGEAVATWGVVSPGACVAPLMTSTMEMKRAMPAVTAVKHPNPDFHISAPYGWFTKIGNPYSASGSYEAYSRVAAG